jgi:hypothetical protein
MLGVRSMLGVGLLVIAPVPAQAADGLEFLDTRPIVVDLDRTQVGQQWRVRVLDGLSGGRHNVMLHAVFQPAGVMAISGSPVRQASQGDVVEFVIRLRQRVEGSGELVVVSGGTVARRPIRITSSGTNSVQVGSLQFAGTRLVPFTGQVRVPGLTVRDAPGGTDPDERSGVPRRIGALSSDRGDLAEVVRRGDDFFVEGAEDVGMYVGSLDLLPALDGGEVEATLRVRDLPAWPLLVLLLGLAVVQALDRYQHRLRPRRLLELRLARLRDRARAAERETEMNLRICALPGDPGLLLDKLVAEALASAGQQMTDAEWARWDSDGAEYQKLSGVVESFRQLTDSFRGLGAELKSVDAIVEPADRDRARTALIHSVVGAALRGRAIESTAELSETSTLLESAKKYLRDFRRIYRTLARLRYAGSLGLRDDAVRVLTKLFEAPDDLTGVDAETNELYRRWEPAIAPQPEVAAGPVTTRVPPPPALDLRPPVALRGGLRRLLPAVLAAGSAVLVVVVALSLYGAQTTGSGPTVTATPSPSGRPTVTPTLAPTPVLPEAPVATPLQLPEAPGFQTREPSAGRAVWLGVVLPLLLTGLCAAVGWLVLRSWRRRQLPRSLADLDTSAIDRALRVENLRFALVSGAFVVLSGMSLLYVGNPTFGCPGDYLAVALWGTGVGEGLHLARRLWPFPSLP